MTMTTTAQSVASKSLRPTTIDGHTTIVGTEPSERPLPCPRCLGLSPIFGTYKLGDLAGHFILWPQLPCV